MPKKDSRQAGAILSELVSCPEAVDLCADAFARSYSVWRAELSGGSVDGLPVAAASEDSLFQMFLAELRNSKGRS